MTDTTPAADRRGFWAKRIVLGLLAIIVIVGIFLASNALTIAWQARESLHNQIRADVRATVAAIKDQPLGTSNFTLVNAANDYALGYTYSYLQAGSATSIVPVKHNQAVDRILILPSSGKVENLSGALDTGSTVRGYRVVGISLSDSFAYSFNSKNGEYADTSFTAGAVGSSRFDTKQATLVYSQQPGQERLTVAVVTTLNKDQPVRVPGASTLDKLTLPAYTRKATSLTAFKLSSDQVALHDRDGKLVAVPDAKWDATFIIAQAPQESSIQFSTPVSQLSKATLSKLADGGYLQANYRGLTLKLTFGQRTFAQVYATAAG